MVWVMKFQLACNHLPWTSPGNYLGSGIVWSLVDERQACNYFSFAFDVNFWTQKDDI